MIMRKQKALTRPSSALLSVWGIIICSTSTHTLGAYNANLCSERAFGHARLVKEMLKRGQVAVVL